MVLSPVGTVALAVEADLAEAEFDGLVLRVLDAPFHRENLVQSKNHTKNKGICPFHKGL